MDRCPTCGRIWEKRTPHSNEILEALVYEFHMGYPKARGLIEKWGYTQEDMQAWREFAKTNGRQLTIHLIQRMKRPESPQSEFQSLGEQLHRNLLR